MSGATGATAYVPVRDDAGIKSLSINERAFLRSCALSTSGGSGALREDGRNMKDIRKIRLQLGRWDNGSECTVQWGVGTRVTSLCSAALVPPSPDRPSDGMVNFTVDLSPMACTSFLQAPPVATAPTGGRGGPNFSNTHQRLLSNRILRCLERIILTGGALDTEALVLFPGKWVWRLSVSLTVLDQGGNLLDACVFAAMAALRHYRKPHVDLSSPDSNNQDEPISNNKNNNNNNPDARTNAAAPVLPTLVPSIVREATPLPLHHTPLSISFALIPADDDAAVSSPLSSASLVAALVDPTDREELVQLGSLTVAMNVHSEVCLLDYGGGCELTPSKLKDCWKLADTSVKHLCHLLEVSLKDADDQANRERLFRLQQQQNHHTALLPLPPRPILDDMDGGTYFQLKTENQEMEMNDAAFEKSNKMLEHAQAQADEAYRQQALDYSRGHVATAVRENDDQGGINNRSVKQQAGSLLATMLKSAAQNNEGGEAPRPTMADTSYTSYITPGEKPADKAPTISFEISDDTKRENIPTRLVREKEQVEAAPSSAMQLESDEEESTMVLQNEFHHVPAATSNSSTKESSISIELLKENVNEDEITDLSMAIKKKKKTKKKK
jgi:exosome complex component RRP45